MVTPTSFAFHVTYTCPLTCAHCCFSSSPDVKDKLPISVLEETIDKIDNSSIGMVAFTGGEPMLLGKNLYKLIQKSKNRGFVTRLVTSAYFGKVKTNAEKKIEELKNAGIDEISISWDDYHEEFVNFDAIKNVFWASKKADIRTAINIIQDKNSRWNRDRVIDELGLPNDTNDIVVEGGLNLTGRADEMLYDKEFLPWRFLGPCPYVISGPTLSAKSKLLACCGVIPETDYLVVEENYNPQYINEYIEKMRKSPLLNWLYLRGPYAIMEWISEEYNIPIVNKLKIGGNCEACKLLFATPEIREKIPHAIKKKTIEINSELELLQSLGLLRADYIQSLWIDKSFVTDLTAFQ